MRNLILLFAIIGTTCQANPANAQNVTKWEYRVESKTNLVTLGKMDLAAGLNALGEKGWELVAVDSGYIFKRPRLQSTLADLKSRVVAADAALLMAKERFEWSQRLAKKGFITKQQVEAEHKQLRAAELALEKARRQLKGFSASPEK